MFLYVDINIDMGIVIGEHTCIFIDINIYTHMCLYISRYLHRYYMYAVITKGITKNISQSRTCCYKENITEKVAE